MTVFQKNLNRVCPVLEKPTPDNPILDFPIPDYPTSENPMQLNKDILNTDLLSKEKRNTDIQNTLSLPFRSPNHSPFDENCTTAGTEANGLKVAKK